MAIIGNIKEGIININYKIIIKVFIKVYFKIIAKKKYYIYRKLNYQLTRYSLNKRKEIYNNFY